jgi:hypothetical protein
MPSGILPDEGIGDQLSYLLSAPITGVLPWQLVLFVNDLTPSYDTVFSDLEEATWPGYSRQTLSRSNWTVPTVYEGCASSTWGVSPIVLYVGAVGSVTNYGCAYYDQSNDVLRWVQRFDDADIAPLIPGGQFQLLPVYTLTSADCAAMMLLRKRRIAKLKRRKGQHG